MKVANSLQGYDVVLFDLDDTLITSEGKFPEGIWDMRLNLSLFKYLKSLDKIPIIGILTNQGGIEAGFVKESSFICKLSYVVQSLKDYLNISEICSCYCTSNDKGNIRRKPNNGMFVDFLTEVGISKKQHKIIYVGDASGEHSPFETFSDSDFRFAVNCDIDYCDINSLTFNWTSKH